MTEKECHWHGILTAAWKKFGKTKDGKYLRERLKVHDFILWKSRRGGARILNNGTIINDIKNGFNKEE